MRAKTTSPSGSRGFTLIEVAVAIALLGAALTTLITFQTRMMDNYINERNMLRATLAAQYLTTFVETQADPPDPGTIQGALIDGLREKGYFDASSLDNFENNFKDWNYTIATTSVDYAEFSDILRRVEVSVSWGTGDKERTSLVLFMNTPISQQTTTK